MPPPLPADDTEYVVEAVLRCRNARQAEAILELLAGLGAGARLDTAGLFTAAAYDGQAPEPEAA
jgi:hypothetical protein